MTKPQKERERERHLRRAEIQQETQLAVKRIHEEKANTFMKANGSSCRTFRTDNDSVPDHTHLDLVVYGGLVFTSAILPISVLLLPLRNIWSSEKLVFLL